MKPLVSVIIPCYNAGRWILDTLECLKNQTHENIEIIIVDDGSTDTSCEIVSNFPHRAITLVRQSNSGAAAARNKGFAACSGDFIQYLDSDDLLAPDKIELQVARLSGAKNSVASSAWARFSDSTDSAVFVPDSTWSDLDPIDWLVTSWREGGGMLFPAMWLIPRDVAMRAGPWNEMLTLNDDGDYFARVVLASEQVLFCENAKCFYRSGIQGSLSGLKTEAGWRSQYLSIELCSQHLLAMENSERTRRAVSMLLQSFAHSSYPYNPELATLAMKQAENLHSGKLNIEGGPLFKVVSRFTGWKFARRLQKWTGRH